MLLGTPSEDMLLCALLHATRNWWKAWPYSMQPPFGDFFLIQLGLLDLLKFFHGPGHSLSLQESGSSSNLCKFLHLIPRDQNYYLMPWGTYFWARMPSSYHLCGFWNGVPLLLRILVVGALAGNRHFLSVCGLLVVDSSISVASNSSKRKLC